MSHDIEDEIIAPVKVSKARSKLSDRLLVATGLIMASAAALFPWYVFFNADKFGIRTPTYGETRDLPPGVGRAVVNVSPLALTDSSKDDWPKPPQAFDDLTTGTTSALGDEREGEVAREQQPLPGKGSFRLLHVANGRALIEDGSGMYMVQVGSILPDNSKLATLEQRDGRWTIVTSAGEVYNDRDAPSP